MRCKSCEYPLWNIRGRKCPECGAPFAPSEFEFVINSVRFCCPHCAQDYYGTGAKGHLVPRSFACVKCNAPVNMDEMVLLPTEGRTEEQTRVEVNPWLARTKWWESRLWSKTILMALFQPGRLARITPPGSSVWRAVWFGWRTNILYSLLSLAPFVVAVGIAGGSVAAGALPWVMGLILGLVMWVALVVLALGAWAVTAHGALMLTGKTNYTFGRTMQTLSYASGANLASAVPCIGIYTIPIGWCWSAVSGALMLREAQGVSTWRAFVASLVGPVVALALVITSAVMLFFGVAQRATTAMASAATLTSMSGAHLVAARDAHHTATGAWPAHPVELVDVASVWPMSFAALEFGSNTRFTSITVAGVPLTTVYSTMSDVADRAALGEAALKIDVRGAAAHRLGDMVFTDQFSAPPADGAPPRWMLIVDLDPASNSDAARWNRRVWLTDGAEQRLSGEMFDAALKTENEARTALGLAPIPPLESIVTPTAPAPGAPPFPLPESPPESPPDPEPEPKPEAAPQTPSAPP